MEIPLIHIDLEMALIQGGSLLERTKECFSPVLVCISAQCRPNLQVLTARVQRQEQRAQCFYLRFQRHERMLDAMMLPINPSS